MEHRLASPAVKCVLPGLLFLFAMTSRAQVTTGTVEGMLLGAGGRPLGNTELAIAGGAGLRVAIRTDPNGAFIATLPYGTYRFGVQTVYVAPWQTTHVTLAVGGPSGTTQAAFAPGIWADATRARTYPEAFGLPGMLLSREPSTVTGPLDFTRSGDNRFWLESQRALSFTSTQFKLEGIDATDSYQPGRPLIVPEVEGLEEVVVRSGFAQTASTGDGSEAGLFLSEGGPNWHGSLASADTGSLLESNNLPPAFRRGLVQQASSPRNRFNTPSGLDLITANGVPGFVMRFNTPADTAERTGEFAGYAVDHVALSANWVLERSGRARAGHSRRLFSPARAAGGALSGFWRSEQP
jgi:hypothetical protein